MTPYDQSSPVTTPKFNNLDYTNQDFWSLKTRLVQYIQANFPDDFNDFVEGDLAVMLMEIVAFCADLLSFKIDQVANEVFIDTVTEVENAFRLCKLVGFQPQPPVAAASFWTATINNVLAQDVIIPAPTQLGLVSQGTPLTIEIFPADSTGAPIFGQDIVIPAGSLVNSNIVGLEGKTTTDEFVGDGSIGQSFQLTTFPVIFGSVAVTVNGVTWNQVDAFTDSNPRQEYRVEFDSSYVGYVIFGNNVAGLIPSAGAQIAVTYRRGGGTIGNITTGSVNYQISVPVEGLDHSVPIQLVNYTRGSGGYDGDQIDDIRRKLPLYLRTQNRCVTGTDYQTIADQFVTPYNGQVGKSTAVLRNYGCAANVVDIFVLALDAPNNLIPASDQLKSQLLDHINSLKMMTDYVCIADGVVLFVEITVDLILDKFYRKFQDDISARVNLRINQFFNLTNWQYGQTLKDSDLIKSLADISQLQSVTVNFTTNDASNSGTIVTARYYEIIRPDNVNIAFLYV